MVLKGLELAFKCPPNQDLPSRGQVGQERG